MYRYYEMNMTDVVDVLLKLGCNPNDRNNKGETSLHIASTLPLPIVLHKLIQCGGDVTLTDNLCRSTLYCAVESDAMYV